MKNAKKTIISLVCIVIFSCLFSISAFANSPKPAPYLNVTISNAPENAVYADLLIKIDETDPHYIDFQVSGDYGSDKEKISEILNYSEEGFRSFTLHYRDAKSNIEIDKEDDSYWNVDFCDTYDFFEDFTTQFEDLLENYNTIKIALLDENYKIIAVSEQAKMPKDSSVKIFLNSVVYDVSENTLEMESHISSVAILLVGLFSVFIMIASVITEFLAALFFKFKGKHFRIIAITNICSQIIMRMFYFLLPLPYIIETIILEILVYSAEFLVYKKTLKDISIKKILTYTVIANTLSLIIGVFLDIVLPF